MNARRFGYAAAWLMVTALATAASMTAVGLVGASATDSRAPLQRFASLASTTTGAPGTTVPSTAASSSLPPTTAAATTSTEATLTTSTEATTSTVPASSPTTDATSTTTIGTTTTTTSPSTTTTTSPTTTTTTLPTTGPFTFPVEGGSVTVSCMVDLISLDGAIPNGGFSVEIEKSGPEEVRVEFHGDEIEIEVTIECEGGVAILEVEESGS